MHLAAPVRKALISHAREATPAEACGLLGGREGDPPTVLDSIRTPNIAENPKRRFVIDPEALLAGRETLLGAGHELLGFYHSHPEGPDEPSATDQETARWAGKYTIIVSLVGAEPTLSGWFFTGETFRPVPIADRKPATDGDST